MNCKKIVQVNTVKKNGCIPTYIKSETTITIKQKPETVIVLKQKLLSFVMTPSVVQ